MSYCVNCGVELAEYEKCCPLCDTEVINPKSPFDPKIKKPYPTYTPTIKAKPEAKSVLAIVAIIFMLPCALCLLADILTYKSITWSAYVLIGLAAVFSLVASSLYCRKISPILEEGFDGAVLALTAMYVNYETGGTWFLTFALPVIGYFTFTMIAITLMKKILKPFILSILGGSCFVIALFCVLVDVLLPLSIGIGRYVVGWSLFPLVTLFIIGTALLFIDKNIPLKRKLAKMFFI